MPFAEKLQAVMRAKNMRHVDLAEAINVSRATVTLWTQGKTTPRLPELLRVADALGVRLIDLLDRPEIEAEFRRVWEAMTEEERIAEVIRLQSRVARAPAPPEKEPGRDQ